MSSFLTGIIPDPTKAAADAAKAAADAAKAAALSSPTGQAALNQVRTAADTVGLGGVLSALEAALGIKPPKCTNPELIDHPKDDGIMTESAKATYQAITMADAMFGYLHVELPPPNIIPGVVGSLVAGSAPTTIPEYLIKSKDNLWKLSIVAGVSLIITSSLYAKLK